MFVPGAYRAQKRLWFPWNWSYGGSKMPCRYWVSNLGPLKAQ